MVTELWVQPYLNFGRTFPRGCQWCNLRVQGNISRWKYFFQNSKQIFFSELGQKSLSFPYQNVPGTTIKNGLFSCRLTHSMKWFSLENLRFRRFNWILRGKSPAELSKKGLRLQKNNWGKWFSTSIDLILEIVSSHRTIFFRIYLKVLNKDVNTAFSASRWTSSARISFIGTNYQCQFILRF